MNQLELKPNQQIGIFYYDNDRLGSKAEIGVVAKISPTGQVTLTNGKRYTSGGKEIGAVEPSSLCSIERAQEVMRKSTVRQQQKDAKRLAYLASPEGKRNIAARAAAEAMIAALNQYGWYADINGEMDVMESEVKEKILSYLERYEPVN